MRLGVRRRHRDLRGVWGKTGRHSGPGRAAGFAALRASCAAGGTGWSQSIMTGLLARRCRWQRAGPICDTHIPACTLHPTLHSAAVTRATPTPCSPCLYPRHSVWPVARPPNGRAYHAPPQGATGATSPCNESVTPTRCGGRPALHCDARGPTPAHFGIQGTNAGRCCNSSVGDAPGWREL
jgi:hypothetical protein